MNVNTLLDKLVSALAADEALTMWCEATYGRVHKVFVNLDIRNLPGAADCPFVAIRPTDKDCGRGKKEKGHIFEAVCCVHDEETLGHEEARLEHDEVNIVEYAGVRRLEEMRKKAENAMAGIDADRVLLNELHVEYETIEEFPFMKAFMDAEFTEKVLIGSDPLE